MKILIDNGHGIDTKGKRSPDGRLLEYAQNRLLAGRIVTALPARGRDASLLVPEETDISLPERCRRVNEWCRQLGKDNVLLISIHCNAAGRGDRWLSAHGWCAYTTRGNTQANALATSLYEAAKLHLPGQRLRTDYTDGDPDLEADFYILRHTAASPSSPKTSLWTPAPTAPSSSPKKADNPLLTSMSTASSVILKIIDKKKPPPFYRMVVFSYFSL